MYHFVLEYKSIYYKEAWAPDNPEFIFGMKQLVRLKINGFVFYDINRLNK